MDDLQFRRSLYADPKHMDEEIKAAMNADPKKQQFAQELEQLDSKIAKALEVDVPDDLANKLILRQTMASHQQQKRKSRVHLALAASVAFAFGLTLNFMQFSSAYSGIGEYALAHVYHEQEYFSNNQEAKVTLASLNSKMDTFDGSFANMIGKLISADYCRFDGIKSLHLVFQGEQSPVNVFIVPERDDVSFTEYFSDKELNGVAEKIGKQNVIIVGDKKEPIEKWRTNLNSNIRWSA